MSDAEYVLGTHEEEVTRLGVQHRVWRDRMLRCCRDAGFGPGSRLVDLGCGPGYATLDLAEIVGGTGSVIAVDQKTREVAIASATCVPQAAFAGFPAKGLMDVQAIVVPGKGVAAAQAGVDRTRKNQQLIFDEIGKGTDPAQILELLKADPGIEMRQFAIVDLQGRSGPVAVLIEYVVRDADTAAFLSAMNERRRIRRRDGARQWELLRDTEHPDRWIESYHVPTWNDYVRHNQRRTHADAAVDDRIRALHSGDAPPVVHRMVVRPTDNAEPGLQTKMPVDLG